MKQLAIILFTDEYRFSLNTSCRRTLIWRETGTRNLPSNAHEINNYDGDGVMVWSGIMLNDDRLLHASDSGSATGVRYIEKILEPIFALYWVQWAMNFILQNNNTRPYRGLLDK